jgi:hypothetical protein
MCWVCLLKDKSLDLSKHLKIFIYGFKMKLSLVLALFEMIMEENILLMNLKVTFPNMG